MTQGTIRLERRGVVGWLWLSRPDRHNAISVAMLEDLHELVPTIADDNDLRALVIVGDGPSFCAGLDLSDVPGMFGWLNRAGAGADDPFAAGVKVTQELGLSIERMPFPTVAAIRGAAAGGGLELALACDVRIVTHDCQLSLPEVTHGLVPDWGGTQRLPRLVGLSRATSMILLAQVLNGTQAVECGLAHSAVDDAELLAAAESIAGRLSAISPVAAQEAKRLLQSSRDQPLETGLAREATAQSRCANALALGVTAGPR
jgi:enoyl-CoA hydratase/carnithine racemase